MRASDDPAVVVPDPLPLFPLQTVMFPGGRLGLKVFEARYLDLVGHCLRHRQPFGVIGLLRGGEVGNGNDVELEEVGSLVLIDDVDSQQAGILFLRCTAGRRFRRLGTLQQLENGLWTTAAVALAADPPRAPGQAMHSTVQALAQAVAVLREQGELPVAEPLRLDDAGWVANRWCELLPLPLTVKQQMMEMDDPTIRLSLVDGFLRDKQVIIGD
ncbi:MAG: LON peptidase substrate-binding domain-containing protein [Rubrivivax sp.]|nr:LON peptidase substrate-binding domain-containing protein [Rubrivivax sp.]